MRDKCKIADGNWTYLSTEFITDKYAILDFYYSYYVTLLLFIITSEILLLLLLLWVGLILSELWNLTLILTELAICQALLLSLVIYLLLIVQAWPNKLLTLWMVNHILIVELVLMDCIVSRYTFVHSDIDSSRITFNLQQLWGNLLITEAI
jgi:hypothetical protein